VKKKGVQIMIAKEQFTFSS